MGREINEAYQYLIVIAREVTSTFSLIWGKLSPIGKFKIPIRPKVTPMEKIIHFSQLKVCFC